MDIGAEIELARKRQAKERGLPANASWTEIMRLDDRERRERLGMPPLAINEIGCTRATE